MQSIQVGQLKSEFSKILKLVQNNGETFVIEYGKKHHKVAMLVPYEEKKKESLTLIKTRAALKCMMISK